MMTIVDVLLLAVLIVWFLDREDDEPRPARVLPLRPRAPRLRRVLRAAPDRPAAPRRDGAPPDRPA